LKGQDEHIKSLFSEKLSAHSSPVDPSAWQAIQAGMAQSAAVSAGSSGFSLLVKLGLGVLGAGIITTAVLLTSGPEEKPEITQEEMQEVMTEVPVDQPPTVTLETPVVDEFKAPPTLNEAREVTTSKRWIKPEATTPSATPNDQAANTSNAAEAKSEQPPSVVLCLTADFSAVQHADNPMAFTFSATCDEAESYSWELSDGHTSSASTFTYEFANQDTYSVRLTVALESEETPIHQAEVQAFVKPQVVIPTIFSPNNDPYNPVLDVAALSINITVKHLAVYNALGALVFETLNDETVWAGNNQYGEACDEGSYVIYYQCVGIDGEAINGLHTVQLTR
jgi:hypothetical protein